MKLSTKVRYGTRAMIDLALRQDRKPVPLRVLAENQEISAKYLEQITASLKIAGLIESVRGAEGGYRLARPAEKITVWDVYCVLDLSATPVECLDDAACGRGTFCAARELWKILAESIEKVLKSHTIRQLADRYTEMNKKSKASNAG